MFVSHHHSASFQNSHCFIHLINASFKITYLVPDSGASPDSPSEKLIQTVRKVKFTWVTIIQNDNSMPKSAMSNILYTKHVNKVIRNIFVQFLVIRGRFLGGTRKYLVIHIQVFRNQNLLQYFSSGAYELNLSFFDLSKSFPGKCVRTSMLCKVGKHNVGNCRFFFIISISRAPDLIKLFKSLLTVHWDKQKNLPF